MAFGFKVADAYVDVHVEDGTKGGRDRLKRDTDMWARQSGDSAGDNWMKTFGRKILTGLRVLFLSVMLKTVLWSSIVGLIGAAVAGLAGYVVQLIGALGTLGIALYQALGIFALLPGAIFAAVTALVALKLAFSGVGSAVSAAWKGDMAAFSEAMKKLAPQAQEAVREIVRLKPALDQLKMTVQNAVFSETGDLIRRLGEDFLPVLERGLRRVGFGLNEIIHGVGEGLLGSLTSFESALGHVGDIIGDFGKGLEPLIKGLFNFLDVSLAVLNVGRVDNWLAAWGESMQAVTKEDVAGWVHNAMDALKLLGGLLVDIGGIFAGLFRAAGSGDIFGWFDKIHRWIDENQPLLKQFFGALRLAADALSPALFELMRVLTDLLIGLSGIMVQISPTLTLLLDVLGQALVGLAGPLGSVLVVLGQALIVLVPPLGQFLGIILEMALPVLEALIPILRVVADTLPQWGQPLIDIGIALARMLVALVPLVELFLPLVGPLLELFADIALDLADVLAPLIQDLAKGLGPIIKLLGTTLLPVLADAWNDIMAALIPLIPLLTDLLLQVLQTTPWQDLITLLAIMVISLTPLIIELFPVFVDLLRTIIPLLPSLTQLFSQMVFLTFAFYQVLLGLLVIFTRIFKEFIAGFLVPLLRDVLIPILTWVIDLITQTLRGFLSGDFSSLDEVILRPFKAAWDKIKPIFDNIVGFFTGLGTTVINAVVGFADLLFQAGKDLIEGLIRGIKDKARDIGGIMKDVAKSAWNSFTGFLGIGSPSKLFATAGEDSMEGYIIGWERMIPALQASLQGVVSGLPGALASANQGLVGALQSINAQQAIAAAQPAPIYVAVQIGDRSVTEMVEGVLVDRPELVAVGADEGHRAAAFAQDPARKRVGTR